MDNRTRPIVVSATIGTDPTIPPAEREAHLKEHVERFFDLRRVIADLLLERLLVDGLEHRIQLEDIEALCATEKTESGRSPMLMRKVIIEFMLSLRRG